MGKGVGGWVLKDLAAPFGLFGYTLKGIQKQFTRGRQPTAFIEQARILQGERDIRELSEEERAEATQRVMRAWGIIAELRKERKNLKDQGIRGRVEVYQTTKRWERYGVFENVEQTGRALAAEREGEDFEEVFEGHRRSLKRARRPRRMVVADEGGKGGKAKAETEDKGMRKGRVGKKAEKAEGEGSGQMDGTVLAGGQTGTDVLDQATATGPRAAEALVNPNGAAATTATNPNTLAELHPNTTTDTGATPSTTAVTTSPTRNGSDAWPPKLWVPAAGSAVDGAPLEERVRVGGDAAGANGAVAGNVGANGGELGHLDGKANGAPGGWERSASAAV